ncbi:MAG TPA: dienelactone hydrolase family protein [Bacteroidales bacterium]|nr:dienelactone hydrolase family protein [Bacteroidales bacterium]
MKNVQKLFMLLLAMIFSTTLVSAQSSDKANGKIKSEEITYKDGEVTLNGVVYYPAKQKGKQPAILVVPEWWGLNDYVKSRARMLAELGYVAMAVDMYGNGLVVDNPADAQANAGRFYGDPNLIKSRMQAAYNTVTKLPNVDDTKVSSIGYCFGGTVSLFAASLGIPLQTVVSFHGGLTGFQASPAMQNTKVLVCHGASDLFVPQADIDNFHEQMKNNNITYQFKSYENATHAFTNKEATEVGKKFNMPIAYNEAADKASWNDMKAFFKTYFPINK